MQAACILQWLLFWQWRFAVLKYWNYVQLHCLNKIWIMQLGWTSCLLCLYKDKWWSSPALTLRFSFFVKDSSSSLSSSPPRSSSAKSTSSTRQEDEDLAKGTYTLYLYLDKRCCFWLLTMDTNIFPFLMIQGLQLSSKVKW